MYKKIFFKTINILPVLIIVSFLSGCATVDSFMIGKKTFDYNIPPQIKIEGVKTIAVLSSRTDASQILQAQLMEKLQELNVNLIDTQQLIGIVQERKLKTNAEALSQFGDKTKVDLFLVAEVIGPNTTAFKVIEKDGRVSLAKFVEGQTDAERVKNIAQIFKGYKTSFSDEFGYLFPLGDKNKDEIIALHKEGKYQDVENRFKQVLMASESSFTKALYHTNLANLYEFQGRFGEALKEVEEAERINSTLNPFSGKIPPEWFSNSRKLLQSLISADNDAKVASGSLKGYIKGAPNIAVIEFDTKAITDKSVGWLASVYISTYLAQSSFNVYDRDYFRSLIQTEASLSEKEQGELFGVDKLVYGKFLKKTQVRKTPIYKTVDVYQPIYNSAGKQIGSQRVQKEVLEKILVNYELEIQGRATDVKTAFGKFQTVRKEPIIVSYEGGRGAPASDRDVEAEWELKLYSQLASWIEKTLK